MECKGKEKTVDTSSALHSAPRVQCLPTTHVRQEALVLRKQKLTTVEQHALGHLSQDTTCPTAEEGISAEKLKWAEMLMLGIKISDDRKS